MKIRMSTIRQYIKVVFLTLVLFLWQPFSSDVFGQCQGFEVDIEYPPQYTYCIGDLVTLVANVTGGTPPYTYQWGTGGTDQIETLIGPDPQFTAAVTVTDANGCIAFESRHIKGYSMDLSIIVHGEPACEIVDFISLYVDGAGSATYLWSTGETTQTIDVNIPGTYSVTATSLGGTCVAEISYTPNFFPPPQPEIVGNNLLCPGGFVNLNVAGGLYNNFVWMPGGETYSTVSVASPGIYSVMIEDENGCPGTDDFEVMAVDVPPVVLSAPSILCPEDEGVIEVVNFTSYVSFNWNNGLASPSIEGAPGQIYEVTATDVNGCETSNYIFFEMFAVDTPTIIGVSKLCEGQDTLELAVDSAFVSFEWSTMDTTKAISVMEPGLYTVTVTDENGCETVAVDSVFSFPIPQPIVPSESACIGTTVELIVNGGPYPTYNWSNGATEPTITVGAGDYIVTVSDDNGCTAEASVTVESLPEVAANISPDPYDCAGSITLAAAGSGTYEWSNGETTASITVASDDIYSVTVTDGMGCTGTAEEAVNIPTPPEVTVNGPDWFCAGESIDLTAGSGFGGYLWSGGEVTESIVVTAPGTYLVTVTDAAGCTATDEFSVMTYPSPTVAITGPSSICAGSTATLSVSGSFSQINWNTGETTADINVSQAGTYSVVATDANGCTNEAFLEVVTGSSLSPSILSSGNGCNGIVTLDAGAGYNNYTWSNGENTPTITVDTNGVYTVTVSDAAGCTGTETITVGFPPPPQVSISGPSAACDGETTSMVASAGFGFYEWSSGETTSSIDILQIGTYEVTATDANGCTAVASQGFDYFPNPTVVVDGPSSICTGSAAQLVILENFPQINWSTGSMTNGITVSQAGIYTVTVTDANGCTTSAEHDLEVGTSLLPIISATDISCDGFAILDAGGGYADYTWPNGEMGQNITVDADGLYTVTVSDGTGCTGETFMMVNLPMPPSVDISGLSFICTGGSSEFSVSNNFPQIIWSTGETTSTVTVATAGSYTVTVTDANGCTASDEQLLEVASSLTVDIATTSVGCDSTASLDAGTGYASYLWSNGSTNPALTVTANGLYAVTVSDANGCTGTASVDVSLSSPPTVSINGAQVFCEGDMTVLAAPANFVQYLWNTGEMTPTISVSEGGIYSVTVTDGSGCTATDIWTLTQLQSDSVFVQMEACSAQDTGVVETLLTNQFGCDSVVVVSTTLASGLFSSVSLTACAGGSADFDGVAITAGSTEEFVFNASNGCDSIVSVSVSELPTVIVDLSTTPSCQNTADGSIQVSVQGSTAPYQFAFNNSIFQPSPTFVGLPSGQYVVSVSDANGCVSEQPVNIGQIAPTVIQLDAVDLTCYDTVVTLRPEVLAGNFSNIQWLWSEGSTTPFLVVNQPGEYSVLADDGCEVQELKVNVQFTNDRGEQDLFYIPNSFSPNDDGFNDEFRAYPGQGFTLLSFELKVFDRWGDMLFGTADVASGWNGIFRGREMQPGVYGWYVKAKVELCGGSQEVDFYQEGGVTIVR